MKYTIAGVDPGLVHTGVVVLTFDLHTRTLFRSAVAFEPRPETPKLVPVDKVERYLWEVSTDTPDITFVEEYRPRAHLSTDRAMVEAQALFRSQLPAMKFVPNMGIKQIITSDLMKLMGVWDFKDKPTHHQDLRSAARIALYGAVKDDTASRFVNEFVCDNLNLAGNRVPWTIV